MAIILLTRQVQESQMNKAIAAIEALDSTLGEVVRIRVFRRLKESL